MTARRHSYSSLQTLAGCERRYALKYLDDLESAKPEKIAFMRGNAWHALLQAHLLSLGAQRSSLLNRPEKIRIIDGLEVVIDWTDPSLPTITSPDHGPEELLCPSAVIAHVRVWEAAQEGERRDEIIKELGCSLTEFLVDLWIRYMQKWAAVDLQQDPLFVEFSWHRKAPNGIILTGRVDVVLFDRDMGLTIVRDSKTHESWPTEADAVLDLMDSQLHLQAWGLAPDLRNLSGGKYVPQAVEFDRVRTKRPTLPKLTTKGILSKTVTDYDSYTYSKWCNSPEAVGYTYDNAVAEKADENTEAWFRRSLKPLSMKSVEAHVKSMQAQGLRAEGITSETAGIVPSKACAWCEFLPLCRTEVVGGRPENFIPMDYGLRVRRSRG